MSSPPMTSNAIEIHTSVTRRQRDYLMHLSTLPGLTKSKTLTELLSFGAAAFLTEKPYLKRQWEWVRPEGYYRYVDNERYPNGDWVALNPSICDIEVNGHTLRSEDLVASMRAAAAEHVPKLRSNDTGMNCFVYNVIDWMCTDLFPPAKYAPRIEAPTMYIRINELPRGRRTRKQ